MTDIVGTSVLAFAGVARQLGWLLTITFIIVLPPVSVYAGVLMSKTRAILVATQSVEPLTMGEAARYTLGGERAALVVYFLVYGLFGFLGNATYLLTMGQALQGTFYWLEICLPTAVLISCLCLMPVIVCMRYLSDTVWLCFLNLFLIFAVLGIVLGQLWSTGPLDGVETFLFADDLSFSSMFGALTNVVYAFTGQWIYFEMMAEMSAPEDFPHVFAVNAPLQVMMYLVVACTGYHYAGSKAEGYFLDNLPLGASLSWSSGFLLAHVCIAFLLKNSIIARYFHGLVSPRRAQEAGLVAHAEYAACACVLLVISYFIANVIPFFSDLLGLIGGLLSGPTSFLLPIAFYIGAHRHVTACGGHAMTETAAVEYDMIEVSQLTGEPTVEPKLLTASVVGRVPFGDMICAAILVLFVILTMIFGTYDNIRNVIQNMGSHGPPFACHPLHQK